MEKKLVRLKELLSEVYDLHCAAGVLFWDQATYMPPAGGSARGRHLGTLAKIAHEKGTSREIGKLLDDLSSFEEQQHYDSDDASYIRVARRDYERAIKIPSAFTAEFENVRAASYEAWTNAKETANFTLAKPHLERMLDYSRQLADFFPGYEHIADPLIDYHDYGMKASDLRLLFTDLRERLVPLATDILGRPEIDDSCLHGSFPTDVQRACCSEIMQRLGFDFQRGRLDTSPHPFMTGFTIDDARITIRMKENLLSEAIFGTIHETGHALYELGCRSDLDMSPLWGGTSSGMHESQSRLWENIVGRSKGFWEGIYPTVQKHFPDQFGPIPVEHFFRAVNKVSRSLIRTEADEMTYDLHVMIRFDLELRLLEGSLAVGDLPNAWNERYQQDLGIIPENDRVGVLQDMHWFQGTVGGMFQGYTIGNVFSAHVYGLALHDHPEIEDELPLGRFDTLLSWLTERIYQHGRKFTAPELIRQITGGELSIEPYVEYLRSKFGHIYGL